jgi:hypothetical protein
MTRTVLICLCSAALALAGCAKVGTLDRPAPLFGEKAKAKYRAEKAAETAAKVKTPDTGPEPVPEAAPGATPSEANPPVTGPSEKVNGQSPETPPSPTLPPVAPQ